MITASDIINDTIDRCGEYLEMVDDPSAFVAEVLAKRILQLEERIAYLEAINGDR
jgi:hypothetical protein